MNITELILKTSSLRRTRLFYHKTLGLDIIAEKRGVIGFAAGRTRLRFEEVMHERPFYHVAFNITNNKFSDSFERMNSRLDILPVNESRLIASYPDWNAQSFYFTDNNGNILEFISRFDLPYHSEGPFTAGDIREVSEIGIVTRNVEGLASMLHKEDSVPYYKKGPRLDDFIAMGDEHGLLLICAEGRRWVPTQRPAVSFPLVVKGDGNFAYQLL